MALSYYATRATNHGLWIMKHGSWTMEGVINMSHLFEISLKCVSIVSELRQDLGVAMVSRCSFNAKKVSRWVSRFASRCRDLCQSASNRLESFQYSPQVRHSVHNRDTFATLFSLSRHLRDTSSVAMFWSIERLIPMLLGDRSSKFTHRDTSPDFLAQINKKNIKYPYSCRDHSLPYFGHN